MTEAFISAAAAIIVCILTNYFQNKKVELHNNAVERLYKVERRLDVIDEKVSVSNHRIDHLEHPKH